MSLLSALGTIVISDARVYWTRNFSFSPMNYYHETFVGSVLLHKKIVVKTVVEVL